MANARIGKERRIGFFCKSSFYRSDIGLGNVCIIARVVEQDGLCDFASDIQMLVNAASVEADGGIYFSQCAGTVRQLASQTIAQGSNFISIGFWSLT